VFNTGSRLEKRLSMSLYKAVWSLRSPPGCHSLRTRDLTEATALQAQGWIEQCNPVAGATLFCANTSLTDGREGPLILYNEPVEDNPTRALCRCITPEAKHFFSIDADCESLGKMEDTLGHIAINRGGEMLRALRRCFGQDGRRTKMNRPMST